MAPAQGWHANSWSVPYFECKYSCVHPKFMTGQQIKQEKLLILYKVGYDFVERIAPSEKIVPEHV